MPSRKKRRINPLRLSLVIAIFTAVIAGIIALVLRFVPVFIVLNGNRNMYVEVYSTYEDPGATDRINGQPITPVGEVDTSVLGKYVISYPGTLQNFQRIVHVVDTTAPEISFDYPYDIYIPGKSEFTVPDYTIMDNYDSDLEELVTVEHDVNTDFIGDFSVTISVKDRSGNSSEPVTKTVHVVDDDFHYLNNITNSANAPEEMLDVINAYMDNYFRSMKYLAPCDPSYLFTDSAQDRGYLSYKAFENLIINRRAQTNDLSLDKVSYSYTVREVRDVGNGITRVFITEDSEMQFHYLKGLTSKQGLIWNYFYFKNENGQYKLTDVFHEESFYLYLYNSYDGSGKEKIDSLSQSYLDLMESVREKRAADLQAVNDGLTYTYLPAAHPYDREKAAEYAVQYGCARNSYYNAHESNCMNFVSQCMHAGGIPFDTTSLYYWKYLSKVHDGESLSAGYTFSWTHIGYFQQYLDNKGSNGMVIQQDVNIYLGEPGDILYVDYTDRAMSSAPHVVLVSAVVRNEDNQIIDLLTCGNTNDQVNYPLSAVGYPVAKLAKISGYN